MKTGTRRFALRLVILLGAVLVLLVSRRLEAQILGGSTGSQMVFLAVQARSAALGDAVAALPGDPAGIHVNPALAPFADPAAVLGHARLGRDRSAQEVVVAFGAGRRIGLGLHAAMVHEDQFRFFTDGEVRGRGFELRTGLSAGLLLTRDLSAGLLVDILHATTDVDPLWGLSAGCGLAYRPGKFYRFGVSLRGLGPDYDLRTPALPAGGLGRALPRVLTLGTALEYPLGGGHRLLLLYQSDKILGHSGVLYRMGVEYAPVSAVAIRGGLNVRAGATEPRAGLGLAAAVLVIDYAYSTTRRDGPAHRITLSLPFRSAGGTR